MNSLTSKLNSKASILPPSSFILCLVGALGFEPRTLRLSGANTAYKAAALPLRYAPEIEFQVPCFKFQVRSSANDWDSNLRL
jgi:hypothetical protein